MCDVNKHLMGPKNGCGNCIMFTWVKRSVSMQDRARFTHSVFISDVFLKSIINT